jgi:DNA-binding MarR family transcriptional regulator
MPEAPAAVDEFERLFRGIYLRFHRRDPKRAELPGASRAVLLHLSQTGPLTVGEMSRHLRRAQSVVSETVEGLERKGLLERFRDPKDKRRTLVWLSDAGVARLEDDRRVLSRKLLGPALENLAPGVRTALFAGLQELAGDEFQ